MSSAEHVAGMAMLHVQIWARAACTQAERIIESRQAQHEDELLRMKYGEPAYIDGGAYLARQADAYMMVIALHQLRMAATLFKEISPNKQAEKLAAAIGEFDNAVPNIKNMRDTLTHFDDYLQGEGRLHRANSLPSFEFSNENSYSAGIGGGLGGTSLHSLTYKVNISPDLPNLEIEIFQAGNAAWRLHNDLTQINRQFSTLDSKSINK